MPVALFAAWVGGWVFAVAVAGGGALMAYEWVRMSDPAGGRRAWALSAGAVAFAMLLAAPGLWRLAVLVLIFAALAAAAERAQRGSQWRAVVGVLYVGLPCLMLLWVRMGPERGVLALIFLFAVVWSADIGAYLSGSWLGGPKLLPRASPNKTWTGLIVGVALGATAGAIGFAILGGSALVGAAIGLPVSLAAVAGDLLESSMKRKFGVKDTGTIIPGHGGVLDRVDALMAAVLMFAALIALWEPARAGFF